MKKVMSLVMAAMVMGGLVAGCGNKEEKKPNSSTDNKGDTSSTEDKKDEGPITFYETGSKTKTLNPHMYETTAESTEMGKMYGNLLEMVVNEEGDDYELIPNHAASRPTVSDDNLTWTFEIRDGVTWSDGTPITAETYEYSYKMQLDSKLKNYRGRVLFSDVEIVNAEKYYNGECEWEDVGIKVDGNKLIFTLAFPVPQMDFEIMFVGGGATSPVKEDLYESCFNEDRTENTYGTSLETTASSGSYTLVDWVRDQSMVYEKNEKYPLADYYTPDRIEVRVVEEDATRLTLFENGDTDYVSVRGSNYDKYAEDPRMIFSESNSVTYMFINQTSETNPILGNLDFRQALFYGMNREMIAKDVYKTNIPAPYYISTFKFVKPGVAYRDTDVAKSMVAPENGYNTEKAKEHFEKAYAANGNNQIAIEMTYFDTSESMKQMAELLEEEYEGLFGADKLDVKLVAVPWNTAYDNMENGKYDVAFGGWSGGTFNPWSSLEVYTSDYPGKLDKFYNEEFDQLFHDTVKGDLIFKEEERIKALGRMEQLLFENMPFVPIYQTRGAFLFSERVKLKTDGKYLPGVKFGVYQAEITKQVK